MFGTFLILEPRLSWEEDADELFARMALLKTGRQIKMTCYSRGYTRHKLQTAATERDEELRAKFREVIPAHHAVLLLAPPPISLFVNPAISK